MAGEALLCSKCQAPLALSATTFSVSCTACGQWHTIDRSGPAPVATPFGDPTVEASVPPPLDPAGAVAAEEKPVDEVLAQLDQEWAFERKRYLVFGLTGEPAEPDFITALLPGLVVLAVGGFMVWQASGSGLVQRLPGLLIGAAGLGLGIYRFNKMQAYQQAHRRYQARRRASAKPADAPPTE